MATLVFFVRSLLFALPALILTGFVAGARSIAEMSGGGGQNGRWPALKMSELGDDVFVICNVRGPYHAAARPDKPFVVVTLYRLTREQGFYDVLLSLLPGQRQNLLDYYNGGGTDTFGPVRAGKVDVGQPNPMWQFVDAAEYTGEIPEGLREAALGGPSEDDDIPF